MKRYETRFKAGEILAELIREQDLKLLELITKVPDQFFCFCIPNGGVPVAEGFCSKLNISYDMLIVRKIKIPFNTEAGFGSITTDGTVLMNEPLLKHLNLTAKEIEDSIETTKQEIKERQRFYKKESFLEEIYEKCIQDKQIFMIDDGLASGFTMLAAIRMVKKYSPKKVYLAIPTAPLRTVKRIEKEVDEIFCPNIRNVARFAVADAYLRWYDVPESEVLHLIQNSKSCLKNDF